MISKRLILFLFSFTFFFLKTATAQEEIKSFNFNLEISGGSNYSKANLIGESNITPFFTLGYVVGIKGSLQRDHFEFGIGFLFHNIALESISTFFQQDFLEITEIQKLAVIPLWLRYDLSEGDLVPFIDLGVHIGFLIDAEMKAKFYDLNGVFPSIESPDIAINDQRSRTPISLNFGLGLKRRIFKQRLILRISYQYGLTKMVDSPNTELIFKFGYLEPDYRINQFVLALGWQFSFDRK